MTVGTPAEPRRRVTFTYILGRLTFGHLLFGMCLILVFATLLQDSLWNANVRSRLATVQSLVERGTLILYYALPILITFLPTELINHAISGSIRPVQLNAEFFRYPGSFWLTGEEALSGVEYNSPGFALRYGFNCLFGVQGGLVYDPLLLIALWCLVRHITSRGLLWVEGAIVLAVSASIAIYYFFSTAISVGIRIAFGGWYRRSHCCGFLASDFLRISPA